MKEASCLGGMFKKLLPYERRRTYDAIQREKTKKKTTKLSKKILTYFLLSAVADERKKEVIPDVYDADDCRRLPSQLGSRRFFQRPKYR